MKITAKEITLWYCIMLTTAVLSILAYKVGGVVESIILMILAIAGICGIQYGYHHTECCTD